MIIMYKEIERFWRPLKNDYLGLFIEGFTGGINLYISDNIAIYRKTFYGDNKEMEMCT